MPEKLALPDVPAEATEIISFDGEAHGPSVVRYNVPLPGRHTGQRVVRLGLNSNDFSSEAPVSGMTESVKALDWKKPAASPNWTYNADKALDFFFARLRDVGLLAASFPFNIYPINTFETKVRQQPRKADGSLAEFSHLDWSIDVDHSQFAILNPDELVQVQNMVWFLLGLYADFVGGLVIGELRTPIKNWDGQIKVATTTAETALGEGIDTNLFLVETYGISSFLGDYGLGPVVRTFTLLPGEETKISIKTWRSTQSKVAEASSIVDSYTSEAGSRFTNTVQRETTDKHSRLNKESWHVEAEVSASWGFGSAKVSGGAEGEYQASRESFAKQVEDAVQEHTSQASSARNLTVTSSTEFTQESGQENLTERTIRNLNLRRVLNFVFRGLNQEHTTKIHLLEVTVGFTNGAANSWREVPLSGLRELLEQVLVPGKIDEVASQILGAAGTVMDINDQPVATLDRVERQQDGTYKILPATRDDAGLFPAPPEDRSFFYRFKRGALAQSEDDPRKVDGVRLKERKITMQTDSVVVEALLGEADALDSYAMTSQRAEAEAKWLANRRVELAIETLDKIADPEARAAAYAQMFNPPPAPVNPSTPKT
jgi:hypothetical protein